jgi:uncharacterized protein involved in outer membrane biogenesis
MPTVPGFLRRPTFWIVVGVLLVAYAAAGFWLVPRLIDSNLRQIVHDRYHRELKLGEVRFNPFTLELVANKLALPDADGGPLLSFERLRVRVGFISVLRFAPDFKLIDLDSPNVRIVHRTNGSLNLLDLVPPAAPKPAPTNPNAPPPRLWIDELSIRDGSATVIDQKRAQPLTLAFHPITFTLRDFSTRSEGNAYALKASSVRGEGFEWQGTFGLAPLASAGKFALTHVQATTLAQVAAGQLPFDVTTGELDLNGNYALEDRTDKLALEAELSELALTALGIRAHGGDSDIVEVPRLAVTGTKLDLQTQSVNVAHVLLEHVKVAAVRGSDGKLNLLQLLPTAPDAGTQAATDANAAPASAPAPPAGAGAKPWTVAVPDIRVSGAEVSLEDRTLHTPATFRVAPIDVSVGGFASPAAKPLSVDFKATVNDAGQLASSGTLTLEPLAAQLKVSAAALPLAALQPYLDGPTALVIGSGTAGADGNLSLDKGALQFEGTAGVDNLATSDRPLKQEFVKWKSLQLAGIRVRTSPLAVRIREIAVHGPYARVAVEPNGITNIKEILDPKGAAAEAAAIASGAKPAPPSESEKKAPPPPEPARAALPVEIALVRIDGGSMNFADQSIKPNVVTGVQELAGSIKGLSGRADSRAEIDLAGQVDPYAPVKISGKVNYLSAVSHLDLTVAFRNVELTALSPYSGHFAGYTIERGKMSADLNYKVEGRRLDATHKITINQLQLGEHVDSPDATGLPVKLAVALLKDRNGVIDLDLPVGGSLDDPKFKIGPLVWKVVVNLIGKAVTAPFKLLGALFGGGEEISFVEFAAGSAAIDATNGAKLKTLVKALDARPGLSVDVPATIQPDTDRAALLAAHWHDHVVARARAKLGKHADEPGALDLLLATPKDYRSLLEDDYRDQFGHRAEIPKPAAGDAAAAQDPTAQDIAWLEGELKGRINVGQDEIAALGNSRAGAVQAALLTGTGIDPGRVFIVNAPPQAATPSVKMQLALH